MVILVLYIVITLAKHVMNIQKIQKNSDAKHAKKDII